MSVFFFFFYFFDVFIRPDPVNHLTNLIILANGFRLGVYGTHNIKIDAAEIPRNVYHHHITITMATIIPVVVLFCEENGPYLTQNSILPRSFIDYKQPNIRTLQKITNKKEKCSVHPQCWIYSVLTFCYWNGVNSG